MSGMVEDVGATIEKMKRELDVRTDAELASALRIGATAVSAWRSRGKVPLKYLVRSGRNRDEVIGRMAGMDHWHRLLDGYVFSLIGLAARKLPEVSFLLSSREDDNEIWLGFRLYNLYIVLEGNFSRIPADKKDDLRVLYEKYRTIICGDDLVEWIETL